MRSIKLVSKYVFDIKAVKPQIITDSLLKTLPTETGVYMFLNKNTSLYDYVGVSNSKEGLKKRIGVQHLRRSYLQSVFRKKLVNEFKLDPKDESVIFIKENYELVYLSVIEHKSIILAIEQILIYEMGSKYNNENKHNNTP
jgi:excinuclease UvrABC nuclease subunit